MLNLLSPSSKLRGRNGATANADNNNLAREAQGDEGFVEVPTQKYKESAAQSSQPSVMKRREDDLPPPNFVIYIDLLHSETNSEPETTFDCSTSSSREDELMLKERGMSIVRLSDKRRFLRDINPSVTFTSPSMLANLTSIFSVYRESDFIHTDEIALEFAGVHPYGTGYLYRTSLVPRYWSTLLQHPGQSLIQAWFYCVFLCSHIYVVF